MSFSSLLKSLCYLGQIVCATSCPPKPNADLQKKASDGRANFPAQRAAGVRGRRQRRDALQAGQPGERLGQRESGVCSRDVSSGSTDK